jgi:Ca2+-binding RTX toxin-like protein
VAFASFGNLRGGSANDTFMLHTGASLSGSVGSQGGRATLSYSAYTGDITVDLPLGTATGVAGGISQVVNVTGSMGNDLIVGDANANLLVGGTGRNILIGGAGADTLTGGGGDNILIEGTTAYDSNLAALQAILHEWTRTDLNFHQRLDFLMNGGDPSQPSLPLLNLATVFDDGAADVLTSGGGLNWYFSHKANDVIVNKKGGDHITLL